MVWYVNPSLLERRKENSNSSIYDTFFKKDLGLFVGLKPKTLEKQLFQPDEVGISLLIPRLKMNVGPTLSSNLKVSGVRIPLNKNGNNIISEFNIEEKFEDRILEAGLITKLHFNEEVIGFKLGDMKSRQKICYILDSNNEMVREMVQTMAEQSNYLRGLIPFVPDVITTIKS